MKRTALFPTLLAIAGLSVATPVLAAAPSNDLYVGRTVIPATPFEDTIDSSEATTDLDDAELLAQCEAPTLEASVWYEHTAATDAGLMVETLQADYAVGVIVATGSPGSFSLVTCGPFNVSFPTSVGETYSILMFDFTDEDGVTGGPLSMRLRDMPPPPEIELTIDKVGSFDAVSGIAVIRGSVTCTGGDESSKTFIDLQVSQLVGRFRLNGYGFATFSCDGSTQAWAGEVGSDAGKFGGGKATVRAFGFVCTESGCDEQELTATVTLRK